MNTKNDILDKNYPQYNDYYFKSVLRQCVIRLLKFFGIPHTIDTMILSEYTAVVHGISRIDSLGEVKSDEKRSF